MILITVSIEKNILNLSNRGATRRGALPFHWRLLLMMETIIYAVYLVWIRRVHCTRSIVMIDVHLIRFQVLLLLHEKWVFHVCYEPWKRQKGMKKIIYVNRYISIWPLWILIHSYVRNDGLIAKELCVIVWEGFIEPPNQKPIMKKCLRWGKLWKVWWEC